MPDDDPWTTEQAIGHELTALIRSKDDIDDRSRIPVTPAASVPPQPGAKPLRAKFRLRPGKVADLVGVLLTAIGIWAGYQWFQSLPEQPSASPWSKLGSGRPNADIGRTDPRSGQAQSREVTKRPLGQYVFNEIWEQRPPEDRLGRVRVARYDRIQVLEAAFDVEYVPPPGCLDWVTDADMVRCSNHRMRALRAFVESDGAVTPDMMGIQDSFDADPTPEESYPAYDWRWEQAQQDYGDPEQAWSPTWRPSESDDATRDPGTWQGGRQVWEEDTIYQGGDWRAEQSPGSTADPGSNWQEEPYSDSQGDWGQDRYRSQEQPWRKQTDRHTDEDWPARQEWGHDSVPDQAWRSEDWRRQGVSPDSGALLGDQDGAGAPSRRPPEGYQ